MKKPNMESIKFRIDPKQIDGIKRKTIKIIVKRYVPPVILTFILIVATGTYDPITDPIQLAIILGGTFVAMGLSFWVGTKQAISNAKSFQIELNSEGIQRIMQGMNFITIPWNRLDTQYNKSGELLIVDKKVHKLMRKWNGKGQILVPKELADYSKFVGITKRVKREHELQQHL